MEPEHSNKTNECRLATDESRQVISTSKRTIRHNPTSSSLGASNRIQYSSFVLFLSVVILVNLCPFDQPDLWTSLKAPLPLDKQLESSSATCRNASTTSNHLLHQLHTCLEFLKLMFTSPIRLNSRTTRVIQADAKVIGKMAKMWYIKKKIKKLSKKLKKHTIAVPVFTAIPIYEHPYYPHQQQVGHVSAGALNHAASSYSPGSVLPANQQVAVAAADTVAATAQSPQQALATSASDTHQRMAAYNHHQKQQRQRQQQYHHQLAAAAAAASPIYHRHHHQMPSAGAHQIINSYAPSPPLFVDEAGGLYGQYGNAYGRYDGGYQLW